MRPLAEFIMRGRWQALTVASLAVLTGYFYWIGTAAMALVTLRRGSNEGLLLLLWCLLPAAILGYYRHDLMPIMSLPIAWLAANNLRARVDWSSSLLICSLGGIATAWLLSTVAQGFLTEFVELYREFMAGLQQQMQEQGTEAQLIIAADTITVEFVAGIFGLLSAIAASVSLIIARWWQAMLYNPGGFAQEFRTLRLSPMLAAGLLAGLLLLGIAQNSYSMWGAIFAVPLLFAGIAMVHGIVAIKQWNPRWLVVFYCLLVLIDEVKLLVVMCALIDSSVNIRARIEASSNKQ